MPRFAPCLLALVALLCGRPVGPNVTEVTAQSLRPVDTALVLAIDISNSVDARRYRLQIDGIADALEDPSVQAAIFGGPFQAIAIAIVLWADRPRLALPWARIAGPADAAALAGRLRRLARHGGEFTCVAEMMRFVADKITPRIPMQATRVVLDVSGDGRENCNPKPDTAAWRDELVALGLTVNGLSILEGDEGLGLAGWYRENVIGGPGSFVLPAQGFEEFGRAFRQKFVTEISGIRGMAPKPETVQAARRASFPTAAP